MLPYPVCLVSLSCHAYSATGSSQLISLSSDFHGIIASRTFIFIILIIIFVSIKRSFW